MDEILKRLNLKYEDLTKGERDTLNTWLDGLSKSQVTLQTLTGYITSMRESVEQALIDEPEFNYIFLFSIPNRKQILLKARLRNYLLLESFLATPEKAKAALERSLASITSNTVKQN